jgi:uncharacterized spore protein YtfJ
METTMNKLRDMVDVNTIIGTPVSTVDGITLFLYRGKLRLASGGTDFQPKNRRNKLEFLRRRRGSGRKN